MKILIICPDWFPNISGFGTSCYEFAKNAEKEHKITIITPFQKGFDSKGLNVIPITQVANILGRNPLVLGLLNKIKKIEYDIILLYSYMFEMNSRVAIYRKLGMITKPVVLMYRGSLEDDVLIHLGTTTRIAKQTYDKTLGSAVFKYSDHIISNSSPTLNIIKTKYGIQDNKMEYIPNSININEYKKSTLKNKRVLFNGRLIENKGIKFFDEIIKIVPKDWKFTIIGNGPMEEHIKSLKKKYENIEYLGKLPKTEVNKILSKTDILVLPTFAEGSPRVVLEAAASGVPSIVFDVGDVSTILNNDKNGFVIKKYDIEEFTQKLTLLIKNYKLRKVKGISARKYAEKNLDWKIIYKKMIKALHEVIKAHENSYSEQRRIRL
jgi:glycosyltransferase involved in cell wall biosynthesis